MIPDFCDPGMGIAVPGGTGGMGGDGRSAAASVVSTQTSGVDVRAEAIVDPTFTPPPTTTPPTPTTITFEIGWVSAANPDWISAGSVWERSISMTITAGNSSVILSGAPGMTIDLTAVDDLAIPYFKSSADPLDSDTGSFALDVNEIGQTEISPGQTASIITPAAGITSTLNGEMTANGGEGGGGGSGGSGISNGWGADGTDGANGGSVTGPLGGDGGAGGDRRSQDSDGDQIADTTLEGGGRGGDGGAGESIVEHKDGIFQGVILIEMD